MSDSFFLAVKSTVDRLLVDAVTAAGGDVAGFSRVDLDDGEAVEQLLTSSQPAVVLRTSRFFESPRDPLYLAEFSMGAKTSGDPGVVLCATVIDKLTQTVHVGATVAVHDYSGDVASERLGTMTITSVSVEPQQGDKEAGIRLIEVSAACSRFMG